MGEYLPSTCLVQSPVPQNFFKKIKLSFKSQENKCIYLQLLVCAKRNYTQRHEIFKSGYLNFGCRNRVDEGLGLGRFFCYINIYVLQLLAHITMLFI